MSKFKSGFTLVELSVVIVMIGLIVASVVGGQSLVKTSKMNAQIADFNKFEVAYNAFKLEYDAIPGDMKNASSYWAGAPDGNGNGRINNDSDIGSIGDDGFIFFEHLSRAKLVPETYTNVWTLGIGYPALKINSGKGMVAIGNIIYHSHIATMQISAAEASLKRKASLSLSVSHPSWGIASANDFRGVASPVTISAIDKKIDDGVARAGKFQGYKAWNSILGDCLTGISGDYLLTETRDSCMAEFIIEK